MSTEYPGMDETRYRIAEIRTKARAFADGEVPASPDAVRLGREITGELLAVIDRQAAELAAASMHFADERLIEQGRAEGRAGRELLHAELVTAEVEHNRLTAELDRARDTAVALEQELAAAEVARVAWARTAQEQLAEMTTGRDEWEKSASFLEDEYTKARDRGNRLANLIDRAKSIEERSTKPGSTQDETWMHRNEGFNEARRWFLMLLSDEDSKAGEVPDGD